MANIGLTSEILDGNLSPKVTLPEDIAIVIDRAYSGPSGRLYPVSDTDTAKALYGAGSPLIQGMRHAFAGGAKNVALYRIGGGSSKINNIFGAYTLLSTTEEKVGAGSNLKVYIGPRVNNPARSCVIVYNGGKVVYSNVPEKEVNLGYVNVEGFDALTVPYQVGTITDPVPFSEVFSQIKEKGSETFVAVEDQVQFTLAEPVSDIASVTKTTGDVTSVLLSGEYTVTSALGSVTGITLVGETAGATAGDVYSVYTLKDMTSLDKTANELSYEEGKDSMEATLNTIYELYDSAFVDLESVSAFTVVVDDLMNVRNIAAGDDDSADRLSYVIRSETDLGYSYEWSDSKVFYKLASNPVLTTTDVDLASIDNNGVPIIVKQYNEVDFAHRFATWCYGQSSSANYVSGVIGVKGPVANYTVAINRWVGKKPTKDVYGNIVENGSGLLGNRFMAGTTTRQPGFYLTDTGYPDGTPKYDSAGTIIDIGKYLSIPPVPVYVTTESYTGSKVYTRSSAGAYAGLITQITPGDSTTNQVLPNVTAPFSLKTTQISALSDIGYVVLENKNKGLTVYSGDLATQSASDYDYISTAIAVAYVLGRLRDVSDSYIGKGVSDILMAALYNAIDSELKSAMKLGYINGYSFNLMTDGPHNIKLPLTLIAKEELRSISIVLSLAENADISL